MRKLLLTLIYLMFFLSGSAALMYQVVWVRSLSLIFGGSHLAVATVLSVFMAGLAIGGYAIGRYTDRVKNQLRLYGWLEIGIAISAIAFLFLNRAYPDIYRLLAKGKDEAYLYLTLVRVVFSVLVLIVPTIFMGGTLPVLTKFITRQSASLRTHLSFLYGINTFGAVFGALAAGFYFLRLYSVSTTLTVAITLNASIGLFSLILQYKGGAWLDKSDIAKLPAEIEGGHTPHPEITAHKKDLLPLKLVLFGAGVSGFCALGYEVLWTRMLVVVSGATVYAFTTMLAAFLTGIALGSAAYGLVGGLFRVREKRISRSVVWFGTIQVVIGILALAVTVLIRDLPEVAVRLHNYLRESGMNPSEVRIWANFYLAFSYMLVPAFFMGVAFPLAGQIHASYRKKIGTAVGEVLSYNTVGAIIGAGASGFIMITLFGIERSLQMFVVVNVGFGLLVCASTMNKKIWNWTIVATAAGILVFLSLDNNSLKLWNQNHFATFRNNQTGGYISPELIRAVSEVTQVLYFGEGLEAIISVNRIGDGDQRMLVNGKVVASSSPKDLQLQFALGHLPMLLHPGPEKVLVVGLGTGMTLGATSVHPGVRELVLVEIEPKVVEAARTYEELNHQVLDNDRLRVIYNDGRNFLYTTDKVFDVITADPIHPWAQGASYLYTKEYYQTAYDHLSPEGIMCQWLPLYELSAADVKSVVNTFQTVFPEVMVWLTHYDAILIGSRSPILLDERDLEGRIAMADIHEDLARVMMGSSFDLLSHFVAGTDGVRDYARGGIINTDDSLYLEFSAPFSVGMPVMENNVRAIIRHREKIWPYLKQSADTITREDQARRWEKAEKAAPGTDEAHALFLGNRYRTPQFERLASSLDRDHPEFAPWRFLRAEVSREVANTPVILQRAQFSLMDQNRDETGAAVTATRIRLSERMSVILFTDHDNNFMGQFLAGGADLQDPALRKVNDVFLQIGRIYQDEAKADSLRGMKYPDQRSTMKRIGKYLEGLSAEVR